MNVLQGVVFVGILDAESLCEAVAEIVAGSGLQGFSVVHQGFDGVGGLCAGEFFFIRLAALDDGDRQHFLAEGGIYVQHLDGALFCLFCRSVGSVAFLPQKFPGAEEGPGGLFPSHHGAPLVIDFRQIPVGMDISGIEVAEQGL